MVRGRMQRGELLRCTARWSDTPHVHLFGWRHAVREVQPLAVRRPDRIVRVDAGGKESRRVDRDLHRVRTCAIGHPQRIAVTVGEIHQTSPVRRPRWCGRALAEEWAWRAAGQGYEPFLRSRIPGAREPHLAPVA